jgi:hypothetical protein
MRERLFTPKVQMQGGQGRLREMILYVSEQCSGARYFGAIKLNKIIWKSDFDSYAARGVPITGRQYLKQRLGPALKEMVPLRNEMARDGLIAFQRRDFGEGIFEERTVALVKPNLRDFSPEDMTFVTASIQHYWDMTGMESSDESHGIAWKTRAIGQTMPYESALLSDRLIGSDQLRRLQQQALAHGWAST